MITTNTGAKKLESSDNWREIFPNPDLSTAGAHNASVDAADRIQPEIAPIINGKQCALGAASGDYVLLRNSTITGKSDGAYIATKAIPANTDIDSTYLGSPITGGMVNELNRKLTTKQGSFGNPGGYTTASYLTIKQIDNIVIINGYLELLPLIANSVIHIGVISGISLPNEAIRTVCALTDYAYNPPQSMGYCVLNTNGALDVTAPSAGATTMYLNMTYCVN